MSVKVDAARLLTFKAAMLKDADKSITQAAAQAKFGPDMHTVSVDVSR